MPESLREIEVLALDCQASGATPAHGDLLELGWSICAGVGNAGPVHSHWIVPRTERPIPRPIRELTGWTEECVAQALDEREAWGALSADIGRVASRRAPPLAPAVIHFARFELRFLRDLHSRLGDAGEFPLEAVCVHEIARRLFPELPRRNIRALAGYLGHSPELLRRSAGHVAATAFIWQALVPLLEEAGVRTWQELAAWLDRPAPSPRGIRRVFPLAQERRKSVPDRSGIYRFLRRNGDVLYVGKATSLKKRVQSHFQSRGPMTERGLEMLSQVHDLACTETASLLEAALLEADEIKRLDPPYNVHLRSADRSAWFASRDFREAVRAPDAAHPVGPLPSERALTALWALIALAEGASPASGLCAAALAVPQVFLPGGALFDEGWRGFAADFLDVREPSAARRVLCAARALWVQRGRAEVDAGDEETAPDVWDLARVRRRLERNLVQGGLLVRRARFLCLLADASVAFRERGMEAARGLVLSNGEIVERTELETVAAMLGWSPRRPGALHERRCSFDAAAYDRLRVLSTELRRVQEEGGDVALAVGAHRFTGERLANLMRGL
jgi:DNA polymerase III subunit epsilon